MHVRKCNCKLHLRKTSKTLQEITVSGGPKKPVLAREREARFNVEHRPKVFRSSPSMIKTFEANPNTSCGLRPRLRRDLDHAERQEESVVFTLLLAFSILQLAVCSLDGAVWSVHLALWALELIIKTLQAAVRGSQETAWTLQRLPGGDNWRPGRPKSS